MASSNPVGDTGESAQSTCVAESSAEGSVAETTTVEQRAETTAVEHPTGTIAVEQSTNTTAVEQRTGTTPAEQRTETTAADQRTGAFAPGATNEASAAVAERLPEAPTGGSTEREPGDGIDVQSPEAASLSGQRAKRWVPDRSLQDQITALGFGTVLAEKALFYTNNSSADLAVGWILDNPDDQRPLDLEGFSSSDEEDVEEMAHKMVFVVNGSLRMGVGKVAAQVAHATLGLYRKLLHLGDGPLAAWDALGETKVVLKAESSDHLMDIQDRAKQQRIPYYLVQDAGRTQIAAGSVTVLGLFGDASQLQPITGNLRLL